MQPRRCFVEHRWLKKLDADTLAEAGNDGSRLWSGVITQKPGPGLYRPNSRTAHTRSRARSSAARASDPAAHRGQSTRLSTGTPASGPQIGPRSRSLDPPSARPSPQWSPHEREVAQRNRPAGTASAACSLGCGSHEARHSRSTQVLVGPRVNRLAGHSPDSSPARADPVPRPSPATAGLQTLDSFCGSSAEGATRWHRPLPTASLPQSGRSRMTAGGKGSRHGNSPVMRRGPPEPPSGRLLSAPVPWLPGSPLSQSVPRPPGHWRVPQDVMRRRGRPVRDPPGRPLRGTWDRAGRAPGGDARLAIIGTGSVWSSAP